MSMRDEDTVSQLFVASTHTPVLFFTTTGRVYKLKVWRLPVGTPQSRGKAIVNILPNMLPGEGISAIMPLPEDEESWGQYTVMFATAHGYVRRNTLADFAEVKANGKIAMKFEGEDADDSLIGVAVCTDQDDVLLAMRDGRAIRFPVDDVRVFSGRNSVGVRGVRLLKDDRVISMSILHHIESSAEERAAYLAEANRRRRAAGEEGEEIETTTEVEAEDEEEAVAVSTMDEARFAEMQAREEILLSITAKGFGVRSSAYNYRLTGRGGQGIANVDVARRKDEVLAVFPVNQNDEIVLVTNLGQVIRCPVGDIRVARRGSQGVVVFKVAEGERVVSVASLSDNAGEGAATPDDVAEDIAVEDTETPEPDETPGS
jgi:DNA gyrase subunit A